MLSRAVETPRPLPPAKARRATMQKLSSTPPPAYNSPFTMPSRTTSQSHQDILGTPMGTTFHMIGWDTRNPTEPSSSPPSGEELDWMKEKSREELEELLVAADDLIKEREHEFDLSSTACKNLYQNTVALKSEHDVLLSQISDSPTSSPLLPNMLPRSINSFTSDSALNVIASPHPSLRRLDRKVSANISLLADQNAELMNKLEKLEAGASSADQTGRRELRRLEKEIAALRDAFEQTLAKNEELEEKVHEAVAGEAWRRKQEREAKFRAMRQSGHRQERNGKAKSFAPDGSRLFEGPSDFFPIATSPDPRHPRQIKQSNNDMELEFSGLFPHPEHSLISQLLLKVQELEETNAQILKRQNETADQLSAVQRDTEHISKSYESWADPKEVKSDLESEMAVLDRREVLSSAPSLKIRSVVDAPSLREGTFAARDFTSAAKDRKSVMGLFPNDHPLIVDNLLPNSVSDDLQIPSRPSSPWSESLEDRLHWSPTGLESPALPPLHFFSPDTQELSPLESRPTLQCELSKELGDSWDMSPGVHHTRTSSLYDLGQFSVPATPSPASRAMSRRASDELNFEALKQDGFSPSLPMSAGLLRLSVEPPTPAKAGDTGEYARSPRVQRMSATLRSRTGRWTDRRFKEGHHQNAKTTSVQFNRTGSTPVEPTSVGLPQLLTNAIDTMIDKFDGLSSDADKPKSNATIPSPSLPDHNNALQLQISNSPPRKEGSVVTKKNAFGNILFEVWLWFQFAIIIFVFIYAMAKRGPKLVLVDAERKKPMGSTR